METRFIQVKATFQNRISRQYSSDCRNRKPWSLKLLYILLLITSSKRKMLQSCVLCGWYSHFPIELDPMFIAEVKCSKLACISTMTHWSLHKWEDFKHLTLLLIFLLSQMQMLENLNSFLSCYFKIVKGTLIVQQSVKYLVVGKRGFFCKEDFWKCLSAFKCNIPSHEYHALLFLLFFSSTKYIHK